MRNFHLRPGGPGRAPNKRKQNLGEIFLTNLWELVSRQDLPHCSRGPQPHPPREEMWRPTSIIQHLSYIILLATYQEMRTTLGIAVLMVSSPPTRGFHSPVSSLRGSNIRRRTSPAQTSVAPSYSTASFSRMVLGMATWSNGQAIREYQDFLATGRCDAMIHRTIFVFAWYPRHSHA